MKKYLLLVLLAGVSFCTFSQECTNIIAQPEFQQKLTQLTNKPGDEARLNFARSFLGGRCFTSQQVKQMAMTFTGDAFRLQFAKAAYISTGDRKNYYDVLDAFKSMSAAMRLYHFMDKQNGTNPLPGPVDASPFPDVPYPLSEHYKGPKGCTLPMPDPDFERLISPLLSLNQDAPRMQAGRDFIQHNCVSLAQLMKISSTLELESNRLFFLKEQFVNTYDLENFEYAAALLSNGPYKNEWIAYCRSRLGAINPPPQLPCHVGAAEFEQVKKTLENEGSSNNRIELAKQIIRSKACFRVTQIKELMGLMSFESGKLELAKFSYDYCTDTENYYLLNDALSFSSSKQELMNYVKGKK